MEDNQKIFGQFATQFKKLFGANPNNKFRLANTLLLAHSNDITMMFKYLSEYYNTSIIDLYKMKGIDLLQMFETMLNNQKEIKE